MRIGLHWQSSNVVLISYEYWITNSLWIVIIRRQVVSIDAQWVDTPWVPIKKQGTAKDFSLLQKSVCVQQKVDTVTS